MTAPTVKSASSSQFMSELLLAQARGWGTRLTVLKIALACSLSYAIAQVVVGHSYAVFAPILALLTVQSSLYGTLAQGLQKVTGNILGVVLATLWVNLTGRTSWWNIFIGVLVAVLAAQRLPISLAGQMQIPVSVLLVVVLGPTTKWYGLYRAVDCLIGAAVGIGVAFLIPERPSLGPAQAHVDRWLEALEDQLDSIAAELESDRRELSPAEKHRWIATSRALGALATEGRSHYAAAVESLHFNPRARKVADKLVTLDRQLRWLGRLTIQIRAISYTIDQLYDRPNLSPRLPRKDLVELMSGLATMLRHRRAGIDVEAESREVERRLVAAIEQLTGGVDDARAVLESLSLLGRLDQLRKEIASEPTELETESETAEFDASR